MKQLFYNLHCAWSSLGNWITGDMEENAVLSERANENSVILELDLHVSQTSAEMALVV